MSTKKLSRTASEAGGRQKWDRHQSHKEARAAEREYLGKVESDIENYYEYDIAPIDPIGKYYGYRIKSSPIYRWLASRAGQPWSEVHSEFHKVFNKDTVVGQEVIKNYLNRSVEEVPNEQYYGKYSNSSEDFTTSYSTHSFYVDESGLLQQKTKIPRKEPIEKCDTNQLVNWLGGRIVGKVGKQLFWFAPTGKNKKHRGLTTEAKQWKTVWGYHGNRSYMYYRHYNTVNFQYLAYETAYKTDSLGRDIYKDGQRIDIGVQPVWRSGHPSLRQDRKLNAKELSYWNSIPGFYQEKVLEVSPTASPKPKGDPYGYMRY